MAHRSMSRTTLEVERLESREVPAIVVNGTFNGTTTVATGGIVDVFEIGGTFLTVNAAGTGAQLVTASNTAADNLTARMLGTSTTLTLTNSDGVFIRVTNQNNAIVRAGNSVTIRNVASLNVNMQLGGDDTILDNTDLNATLNGGDGNDVITVSGNGALNPNLLLSRQEAPGLTGFDPLILGPVSGQKTLQGGAGDDQLVGPTLGFTTVLDGGDGNDMILGGFGQDIIIGGQGLDVLLGQGGNDLYIALDFNFDLIGNQAGDAVLGDTFDLRARK